MILDLINCNNLTIGYENKKLISGLSFKIEKGDFLCITGENGAGKSTLLKTLLKFIPQISGDIISAEKKTYIKKTGYLPQQSSLQKDFPASVWEIVLSGTINDYNFFPFYTKHQKRIAEKNLERMDVMDLRNCSFSKLSGGQKQRVLLARALCAASEILFLDEPSNALDVNAREILYRTIINLNKNETAVVMVTHDLDFALKYSKHILNLCRDCYFFGSREEFINQRGY